MAVPDGITGHGTKFNRHDGTDFVEVANVFDISGPSMSRDVVEVTAYDSPDGYREKIGGLRDGGQLTFTLNFTRENYLLFKGDFEDDTPVQYQVVLPDAEKTELTFSGLVIDMPLTIPVGDRITIDVTIEISGKVDDGTT